MNKPKAIFSWSGGKDSAYCLDKVLAENTYDFKYLLTSLNSDFKRISMHGVREELVDLQAASIGIPLLKVWVSEGTNEEYERQMENILLKAKAEGIEYVIFGDIFLEDLRAYRETNLSKIGMKAIFPLWKIDTSFLIQDFIQKKYETLLCCVNDAYLDENWVGRKIDQLFVEELPKNVDACGENGEFHSFCYAGAIFKKPIHLSLGEKVYKPLEIKMDENAEEKSQVITRGFWYIDLIKEE